MTSMRLSYVLALLLLTSGCSTAAPSQSGGPAKKPSASSTPAQTDKQNLELQTQIKQIAGAANGRVGVAAVVLETGESVSLNASEPFPMQSVYKLPIGMTVLSQVDAGKLTLDQKVPIAKNDFVGMGQLSPVRDNNPNGTELTVRELLTYAVSVSDGTASDVLMRLVGGPQAVNAYLATLNISEIVVLNTEKELGLDRTAQYRNFASPDAAVALLRALFDGKGLSQQSQALIMKLLTETRTWPNRLKGLLPPGTIVAHKTGSSGTIKGLTAATNDIGIITLPNGRHVAIAVFVSDSTADEATREGVIARIAKAVWDAVGVEAGDRV